MNRGNSSFDSHGGFRATMQAVSLVLAAVIFNTNTSSFMVVIADVAEYFAPMGMSGSQVSLMQTLPSLCMIPTVLCGVYLKERFSQKTLTIAGWGIYGFLGFCLMFIDNWISFIAVRACMGIGLGVALPQAKAMITKIYNGSKRAKMIGYVSMTGGLVGVIISTTLGYVGAISWRYAMLVYPVFALVVIVLVSAFVPKLPLENREFYGGQKQPLNKFVFAVIALGFVVFVICSVIQIKAGVYVRESGFGSTTYTGYLSACGTFGTFCGGLLFGRIYKVLGRWSLCFSALIAASAYIGIATAGSFPIALVCAYFAAFGSVGTIMPYLITRISFVSPPQRKSDAVTYLTASTYGGQFFGTFFLMAVEALFGGAARTAFASVAVVFVVLLIVSFLFMLATKKESDVLVKRYEDSQKEMGNAA